MRFGDRPQLHAALPGDQKIIEPHRVDVLFLALHSHPMCATAELLVFAVGRHRHVAVHCEQLIVDLVVDGLLHGFVQHHETYPSDCIRQAQPTRFVGRRSSTHTINYRVFSLAAHWLAVRNRNGDRESS